MMGDAERESSEGALDCSRCGERFPIINGIPRMLSLPLRNALLNGRTPTGVDQKKIATAESFGFEWNHFSEMRDEWERNFLEYMKPRGPEFFQGKRVLDAGCGSGRHAYYAARYGADVWAVDLGSAVEVARRNTTRGLESTAVPTALPGRANIVQADLYQLPFALESFDFIYSIGALHHLPGQEAAFRNLLRYLKPGGEIQIYLYWKPEGQPVKRAMLAVITAMRKLTTRLPHKVLYAFSYPLACAAFAFFVWPYQLMSRAPGLRRLAERLPMTQYARYPFRVCVNDQFDRFSAPIENRYTRSDVEAWLDRAGLEDPAVLPNYGWIGTGRKPVRAPVETLSSVAD